MLGRLWSPPASRHAGRTGNGEEHREETNGKPSAVAFGHRRPRTAWDSGAASGKPTGNRVQSPLVTAGSAPRGIHGKTVEKTSGKPRGNRRETELGRLWSPLASHGVGLKGNPTVNRPRSALVTAGSAPRGTHGKTVGKLGENREEPDGRPSSVAPSHRW